MGVGGMMGAMTDFDIAYGIVAVDKTGEGIDSAISNTKAGTKSISEQFFFMSSSINMALSYITEGFNLTVGAAMEYQSAIQQFSYVTGLTTDQAQRWKAAAVATDTDFSALTVTMQNLNARIGANNEDGANLRETLRSMGIAVKDSNGNYVDADTLMKNILQTLDKMPTVQQKDAAAKAILGRSWSSLAEMINKSGDALKAYNEASPAMSTEDLEKIDRFKTKWAELGAELEAVQAKAGLAVIDIGERTVNGMKIWDAALKLDLQGVQDAVREMNDAKLALDSAVRESWEQANLKTSGRGLGEFVPMSTWNGLSIGMYKQAMSEVPDPFEGLSEEAAVIQYLTDYTIPSLTEKLEEAKKTGTAEDVAKASLELIAAKGKLAEASAKAEKDQVTALVDAYKEEEAQLKKVKDAAKDLFDLDQDYYADMQAAGSDVSKARDITKAYNKAKRKAESSLTDEKSNLAQEQIEYNAIKAGVPLAQVPGTSQYTEAQAKNSGLFSVSIGEVKLSKDFDFNALMDQITERLAAQRQQAGVRTS